MFYPLSAFIGMRYAKASKANHFIAFINLFSVVGIALGLTALITVLSVMNGFEGQLKQRVLGLMPHMVVDTSNMASKPNFTGYPGVVGSSDFFESEAVLQSRKGLQGVMLQAVHADDMQQYSVIAKNMLNGSVTDLQRAKYRIVIGRALAVKLDLNVGDKVRMLSVEASVYGPMGRMPSQRLFTVSGIYDVGSELDDKVVLVHLHDAAKLLRQKTAKLTQTRLFLADAFAYKQVEQRLAPLNLSMDSWRSRQGPLFDAVKMEKNMMFLMLLLVIAVAAFNIVSALVMVVTEKEGDIAILRTQGMCGRDITKIFLFNGLYNGLKGALFGILGGLLLVSQLNSLLALIGSPIALGNAGQGLPVDLQWQQLAMVAAFSLLLCFLATLYPAYRALRVEPAKALKYE